MNSRSLYGLGLDYLIAQVITKSLSMLCAILIVRYLSVQDYAVYTILLAGYTLVVVLSDLGLSGSMSYFMSSRGERRVPEYISGAVLLRRRFFGIAIVLSTTYVWLAIKEMGAQSAHTLFQVTIMLVAGWFGVQWVSASFLLRVVHRFRASYGLDFLGEALKFLVVIGLVQALPTVSNALLAILVGMAVAATTGAVVMRRGFVSAPVRSSEQVRREIIQQLLPRVPSTLYFAFVQILLIPALAVAFAPVTTLAEVGALGRVSAVLLVVGGFLSHVVTPVLVKTADEWIFWKRGLRWLLGLGGACMGFMALCWLKAEWVLWSLGGDYSHLKFELMLAVAGAGMTLFSGFVWELNRTRGLVDRQYLELPFSFSALLGACWWAELSTTAGLLTVIVVGAVGASLFQCLVAGHRIYELRNG